LDRGELADPGGEGRIAKDSCSRHVRRKFFKHFEPFPADAVFECGKSSGVATGPHQAIDEPCANRVDDPGEHNRHATSDPL
jgi:hypothetical protein